MDSQTSTLSSSLTWCSVTKRDVLSFLNILVRFDSIKKNIPSPSNGWTVAGEREILRDLDASERECFHDLRKGPLVDGNVSMRNIYNSTARIKS